jgi:hypothetical protein
MRKQAEKEVFGDFTKQTYEQSAERKTSGFKKRVKK